MMKLRLCSGAIMQGEVVNSEYFGSGGSENNSDIFLFFGSDEN